MNEEVDSSHHNQHNTNAYIEMALAIKKQPYFCKFTINIKLLMIYLIDYLIIKDFMESSIIL